MKSLVKTLNLVESFSLNSGLIMAQGPRGREEECNLFLPFFYPPPFLLLATDWKDDQKRKDKGLCAGTLVVQRPVWQVSQVWTFIEVHLGKFWRPCGEVHIAQFSVKSVVHTQAVLGGFLPTVSCLLQSILQPFTSEHPYSRGICLWPLRMLWPFCSISLANRKPVAPSDRSAP